MRTESVVTITQSNNTGKMSGPYGTPTQKGCSANIQYSISNIPFCGVVYCTSLQFPDTATAIKQPFLSYKRKHLDNKAS